MAFYVDEEEVWKCPKHPSKRRRSGICPICLRDKLITLCTDCGNVRPCECCPAPSPSPSLFSKFSGSRRGGNGLGDVGRVSNLIDSEPSFRRSRSLAVPFLRTRVAETDFCDWRPPQPAGATRSNKTPSFWSVFKTPKSKKAEGGGDEVEVDEEEKRRMMRRSQSVGLPFLSRFGGGDVRSGSRRGWHFPSPIKAFRQTKMAKVVQERSPLHRG